MAGYFEYSKSNNAIDEENNGGFPASILAKKLGVSSKAIKELMIPYAYHHTSCWYNKTDYYDMEYALEILDQLKAYKPKQSESESYIADVKWVEWKGTRKHPKAVIHHAENIEVIEAGSFYIFKTNDGNIKKKIGSSGTIVNRKVK